MSHTPEPWSLHEFQDREPLVVDGEDGTTWVAFTARIGAGRKLLGKIDGYSNGGKGYPRPDNRAEVEANARRIIECVNACAGIENPGEAIDRAKDALYNIATQLDSSPDTIEAIKAIALDALAMLKGGAE